MLRLDLAQLQTVMFLQLAVGGHLLLFVVRTKRSLFQPPYPSARLFWAIVATQIVAVAICWLGIGVPGAPACGDRRGLDLLPDLDGRARRSANSCYWHFTAAA